MAFTHRIATEADIPALVGLMDRAISGPLAAFLTPEQIAASRQLMGLDSQIIADRTYFIVEQDGRSIAAGALTIVDGVAHLAGASTIPEGRKRGAQLALLEYRLRHAAAAGCDLAVMGALPGSGSQRNAERHGFRIAYTRIKWRRHGAT